MSALFVTGAFYWKQRLVVKRSALIMGGVGAFIACSFVIAGSSYSKERYSIQFYLESKDY